MQRQLFPFHFKVNVKRKTYRDFFLNKHCYAKYVIQVWKYICICVQEYFLYWNSFWYRKDGKSICIYASSTKSTSYLRGGNSQWKQFTGLLYQVNEILSVTLCYCVLTQQFSVGVLMECTSCKIYGSVQAAWHGIVHCNQLMDVTHIHQIMHCTKKSQKKFGELDLNRTSNLFTQTILTGLWNLLESWRLNNNATVSRPPF